MKKYDIIYKIKVINICKKLKYVNYYKGANHE